MTVEESRRAVSAGSKRFYVRASLDGRSRHLQAVPSSPGSPVFGHNLKHGQDLLYLSGELTRPCLFEASALLN
jgi:hypothetical protein